MCSTITVFQYTEVLESHASMIQHELRDTAIDWQNIGALCGVPTSCLKDIAIKFECDPVIAMHQMVATCISHCQPPNWETIIAAVRRVGYEMIAQNLERRKTSLDNCETLSEQVHLGELPRAFKKLYPLAPHWNWIGNELGLESHVLERIMSDYSRSVDCLREMLFSCEAAGCPFISDTIKDFMTSQNH